MSHVGKSNEELRSVKISRTLFHSAVDKAYHQNGLETCAVNGSFDNVLKYDKAVPKLSVSRQ
jgi:hypothetical protein